ncbi:MAG: hypothetical protein JXQ66_05545 [Campylobacterales bacterium]|nr:hypothetical protein [Campylobacterales bacterium]
MRQKRAFTTDIVLIDIIDFSKLTSLEQLEIIEYLTLTYTNMIAKMLKDSSKRFNDLIEGYIPTGDGFFCILNKKMEGYGTILGLNFSHLSDHIAKRYPYFKGIRVAVHTGEIYRFKDIMGNKNYIGDGLNDCARYLEIKNYTVSTVMISDSAFDSLKFFLGNSKYFNSILIRHGFKYSQMYEFKDKHSNLKKGCLVWLRDASIINLPSMEGIKLEINNR